MLDGDALCRDRRDPQSAASCPGSFGMWTRRIGWCRYRFVLQPLVQVPEVRLQVLPVLLLRDPIHAHRRILAHAGRRPAPGPAHRSDAPVSGTVPRVRVCARSTTFRSPGDMSLRRRCVGHGPLLKLASTRAAFARPGPSANRSPTSSLICSPPTPSPPSAAAPVPLAFGLPRCERFSLPAGACARQRAARRRRVTGSP